jgi:hypothetical protein
VSDPLGEYSKRLQTHEDAAAAFNRTHIRIGNLKLAAIAAGLVTAWFAYSKHAFTGYWLLAPAALYILLAILHERTLRARGRAETATAFYRQGIARIEDRWAGTGRPGDRFRDENHVYSGDLDLFGRGSVFELLCTARLPMGENWLAKWLRAPASKPEVLERQTLVAELREKLDLQRDLALVGEEVRARLNPESLTAWAETQTVMPGMVWRVCAALLTLAAAAATVFLLATTGTWPLMAVLIVELGFRYVLLRRAETVIGGVSCNAEGLVLFAEILQRLERESFTAPRLQAMADGLKHGGTPASAEVRRLAQIVYWIDAHHSLIAHILELPLLYTVQVAFAAESWRSKCGKDLHKWIDVAGEMEALMSLATYSYEHPNDPFPEFADSAASRAFFDGQELGHPLIAAAKCVRNSVRLDQQTRVLLVSGSNMSGKSTLLRAVGINTVMAMAGAPVRARSLRLSPLSVGSRIRSSDSLQEGRSTFYTEILHIRSVFDLAKGPEPVLFLFDELLEGTNSKDRRIGAESLLRGLLERGAIGIVTTHDLALTEITSALGGLLRNVHFEDQVVDGKMQFDYTLRDGVVTKSNAIELMRLIGLEM